LGYTRIRCAHLISVAAQEILTEFVDESCSDTVACHIIAHAVKPLNPACDAKLNVMY
jgi:hypothetical protein